MVILILWWLPKQTTSSSVTIIISQSSLSISCFSLKVSRPTRSNRHAFLFVNGSSWSFVVVTIFGSRSTSGGLLYDTNPNFMHFYRGVPSKLPYSCVNFDPPPKKKGPILWPLYSNNHWKDLYNSSWFFQSWYFQPCKLIFSLQKV